MATEWGTASPAAVIGAAVFCALACIGAGGGLARLLRVPASVPLLFVLGAPAVSLAVFLAGLCGWLRLPVIAALGVAGIAAGYPYSHRGLPRWPRPALWIPVSAFAAYGILYLANALAPEVSPDGMTYHINLPRRYWEAGGVIPILTSIYAQMPQGMEMLYAFVYPVGGSAAAALVHLLFLAALVALVWIEVSGPWAWAPALLVAVTPVIGADATSAYNDVALAATAFGAFVSARRWRADSHIGWLLAASWLAGFCFSLKYTGALAIVMVAALCWGEIRRPLLWLALLGPALARVSLWLTKNYVFSGNPVAPFANAWFDNPVFDVRQEAEYLAALRPYSDWGDVFTNVFAHGLFVGGILGPVLPVVLLLALAALRTPAARTYLLVGALWCVPFAANTGSRFLIPAIPFVAVAVCRAMPSGWFAPLAILHALASWPAALDWYASPGAWRLNEIPVRAALGLEPATAFLERRLEGFRVLHALQGRQDRILTLSEFYDSLTTAQLLNASASRANLDLGNALWSASRRKLPQSRVRFWFPTASLTALRLRKPGGDPVGIATFALYHLLTPIRPSPRWRASSPRNGYFAHRVLDDSNLTRWYSSTAPGEPVSLEIAFHAPVTCNRVDIDLDSTEVLPPMLLEGQSPDGQWTVLRHEWEQSSDPALPADPRAEALALLHRHGIRYVLLQNRDLRHEICSFDEPFAVDAFRYQRVAQDGPARLYEIVPVLAPRAQADPDRHGRLQ